MKCGFLSEATTSTPERGSCADDTINKENAKVDEVADLTTVLDKGLLDQVFAIMNSAGGVDYTGNNSIHFWMYVFWMYSVQYS